MLLGNYHHARDHQVGSSGSSSSGGTGGTGGSEPGSFDHQQLLISAAPIPNPDQSSQMLATRAAAAGAGGGGGAGGSNPGGPPPNPQQQQQDSRRLKPHSDQVLKCPRCDSMNTKFCYYNNYSLTQPRHFCKNCKRYWTKGGALRNVPVGGGCRKNKRVKQQQQQQQRSQSDQPQAHSQSQQQQQIQPPTPGQLPPDHHHRHLPGASLGLPGDGASSSSILQQQPEVHHFPFDRPEMVAPRLFQHQPISINWSSTQSGQGSISFEPVPGGSILGLNLAAGIKQEPMFDATSLLQQQQQQQGSDSSFAMDHHHHHHHHHQAFTAAGAPELLWRFPQQPKLVSLLEDSDQGRNHKSKMSSSCDQFDQGEDQNSPSPEWQQTSDGFFDSGGFWSSSGAWNSSELHSYAAGPQPPGSHQLL